MPRKNGRRDKPDKMRTGADNMRGIFSLRSLLGNTSRTLLLLLLCVFASQAQPGSASQETRASRPGSTEQRTARYFESIRKSPPQELAFLLKMPKGGDLHNHLSGAIYAESYIQWASDNGLHQHHDHGVVSADPACQMRSRFRTATGEHSIKKLPSVRPDDRRVVDAQLATFRTKRARSFL